MSHSLVGGLIVIDNNTAGVEGRADAVVEYQRNASLDKLDEMVILLGVFGLRDDDAAHLVFLERLANLHFALIALAASAAAVAMAISIKSGSDNIARQPEAAGNIRTNVMLGLVFIETALIYALIVAILVIFVL